MFASLQSDSLRILVIAARPSNACKATFHLSKHTPVGIDATFQLKHSRQFPSPWTPPANVKAACCPSLLGCIEIATIKAAGPLPVTVQLSTSTSLSSSVNSARLASERVPIRILLESVVLPGRKFPWRSVTTLFYAAASRSGLPSAM